VSEQSIFGHFASGMLYAPLSVLE